MKNGGKRTTHPSSQVSYRRYLALVLPFVFSTMTTPLLGAVDTALVGHLPDPAFIGGVAVGAVIFSTLYWLFGFLRVSTTAYTAQALDDSILLTSALLRPLTISIFIGLTFVVLQKPLFSLAMLLLNPGVDVERYAAQYFFILIWGAPFTLVNYVCVVWLMGLQRIRAVLVNQIFINVMNMVLAVLFVRVMEWGVPGIAWATLIAQAIGSLVGYLLIRSEGRPERLAMAFRTLLSMRELKSIMMVNSDLMVRTICLLIVTNHFISIGASLGTDTLAANSVLFQIHYLIAYMFDGFANASSVFSGKAWGEKNSALYRQTLRHSALSCLWMSLVLMLLWWWLNPLIIELFTYQHTVVELCLRYGIWLMLFPVCGAAGIIFFGVFTGMTYTSPVRNSMLLALLVWLTAWYFLVPRYGNDGLWMAYLAFSLGRSGFLLLWLPSSHKRMRV